MAPTWQITGGRQLTPAPFLIAGIVNITPDSFSDGGRFFTPENAVRQARDLVAEGANLVDLGAESTRPGAPDIGHDEEWWRLEPVLAEVARLRDSGGASFAISIDTFRAGTARKALAMGADIINDVSGGSFDPAPGGMDEVLAAHKPGYILGHSPARPDVMQRDPRYDNVVDELLRWFSARMDALVKAGLPEECICLDPCIGFGKTLEHNLDVIAGIPSFLALGRPLCFGISRKSFIGAITGQPLGERKDKRDSTTQVVTALLAKAGVHVHRVHQAAETVATLKLVQGFSRPLAPILK